MVKKDCSQFQKSSSVDDSEDSMYWSYGKYNPKPGKTEEEKNKEIEKELKRQEYLKKIESGEIKVESTYEQLKEKGFDDERIEIMIQKIKDNSGIVYE
jgi:uncharacterized protein YcnI